MLNHETINRFKYKSILMCSTQASTILMCNIKTWENYYYYLTASYNENDNFIFLKLIQLDVFSLRFFYYIQKYGFFFN